MGLKEILFGDSSDSDSGEDGGEFEDEFEDEEWDDEFDDEWEEDVEDEEEELGPWSSARDFGEDMMEAEGFASMTEFEKKVMMREIGQSPLYRDRIQSGVQTMDMVTDTMTKVEELRSGNSVKTDWGEKANELEQADRVIDKIDKLSGKEDEIVNMALGLGTKLVENMAGGGQGRNAPVESTVELSDEDI